MADGVEGGLPLFESKLHPPRRRTGLVSRPRLASPGTDASAPVTVVSAPAGFGKTTLAAEWAQARAATTVAWLSLDEHDDDPVVFWSYLLAALDVAEPGTGADARTLLDRGAPLPAVVTTLANELARHDRPVVLVLDDLHRVASPAVHDSLVPLLEHLPHDVHVVATTRSDPPWPLATWRARGVLAEVRAADLRFREEEAARYVNDTMGLTLTAEQVRLLEQRTEGWIAALQLAALSLQGHDDVDAFIDEFTGDHRYVVDYLVDEVLQRQDEPTRRFLLQTSILERLAAAPCDAVTGGADSGAVLDRLERSNLFVVALDAHRAWYRYHHLFAEVLRSRLVEEHPALVPELHRRAASWHAAAGEPAQAVRHALAAGDVDGAADLVELAVPALRRARQEATLRAWYDALPDEVVGQRPVLAMGLVGVRMAAGEPDGVGPLLDAVERWLETRADPTSPASPARVLDDDELRRLPAQAATYRSALALMAGDLATTTAQARRALDAATDGDELTRGSATALLALAHWHGGELDAAEQAYRRSIHHLGRAGHHADVLGCSLALADVQAGRGRLGAATRTLDGGLALAAAHPALRGRADMHVGLAEVHLERGEQAEAEAQLAESQRLGPQATLPQHAHRTLVVEARLRELDGDLDGALVLLDEAERRYQGDFSPDVRPVATHRVRVLLARGELAAAQAWVDDRSFGPGDELSYLDEAAHLALVRVLLAERDDDGEPPLVVALGLLDRLLDAADAGGRDRSVVEALVLRARAHDQAGDGAAALAALTDALVRGGPEGYVRTFLDDGPTVVALLEQVVADGGPGADVATRVLARRRPPTAAPAGAAGVAGPGPVEPLSSRELDVLRLLRSELTGPEIARELHVSLNTMRTHTKSIYLKLAVGSRRAAVRRADELGL